MHYEVELKYRLESQPIEKQLTLLNAMPLAPEEQVDRYFAHPCRDFARLDEALRIRRIGQHNFITWKGPKLDTTTKTRREIELPIEPGADGLGQFTELLEVLGFRTVAEVRKTRRPFELRWDERTVHVALDEVASVGTFVELELLVAADELDAAKGSLATLASHFGLKHPERRSYLEMQLAKVAAETSLP